MRRILTVLALSWLALAGDMAPASADFVTYPWCAQYGGRGGGGRNCGFWTYEQCMASVRGNGGYCEPNAMFRGRVPGQIPTPGPFGRPAY